MRVTWVYMILTLSFLMECSIERLKSEDWTLSPKFYSGSILMHGIEGHLGISKLNGDVQDISFPHDQGQLFMLHFWGEPDELEGEVVVKASHPAVEGESIIAAGDDIEPPSGLGDDTADGERIYKIALPTDDVGLWKLDVYVEDNLFGVL